MKLGCFGWWWYHQRMLCSRLESVEAIARMPRTCISKRDALLPGTYAIDPCLTTATPFKSLALSPACRLCHTCRSPEGAPFRHRPQHLPLQRTETENHLSSQQRFCF